MLPQLESGKQALPMGFLDLQELIIPRRLADAAQAHMRAVGRNGNEGFALWIGKRIGDAFHVDETLIPEQTGLCFDGGVCVTVGGEELFRINRYLFDTRRQMIAQLHSHPTDAYHSETDDAFPIATVAGAFSLVVPDFAVRPFSLDDCAVYRLVPGEGWLEFPAPAVARVIHLTEG
jgi:hypothetical protein